MASPAAPSEQNHPVPPPAEPRAIRACLTPDVAVEFDREWDIALDQAKRDKDLAPVQDLLVKWRHLAYAELTEPGSYFRVLATAEHTLATGQAPPGSVSGDVVEGLLVDLLGNAPH